jgi:hypothetical protein
MPFIQIVEYTTENFDLDQMRANAEELERATEGRSTVRRAIITQDRNNPNRYLSLIFFDSYESAMENSNLPETQAFAAKMTAAISGPPTFHDLDVLEDRTTS